MNTLADHFAEGCWRQPDGTYAGSCRCGVSFNGLTYDAAREAWAAHASPAPGATAQDGVERAVKVCPQCEGEGSYADGVDEAACTTECTRCGSNGWIVDLSRFTTPTPTIPAGMVAWNGGDSAPEDWDGGKVRLRDGSLWPTSDHRTIHWGRYDVEVSRQVVAYTPLAAAPKQAEQQGVEALRLIVEAVANADSEDCIGALDVDIPHNGYPRQWLREAARNTLAALNAPTGAVEKGEAK